jgi:sulfopropanediol 3-dehydrogenase
MPRVDWQSVKGRSLMARFLKEAAPGRAADKQAVTSTVATILSAVRERGLEAVREYSRNFDDWDPPSFRVGEKHIADAQAAIRPEVLASLDFAHAQIKHFAELQRASLKEFEEEVRPGIWLGQKLIPIANAGAYVPGGKYPMLMSAQMSVLTAKVAGVRRVVACTPPYAGRGPFPETLWSMHLAGADEIWVVGGVQAVALMAYGCQDYDPVDFISGPGNMYVTEAKRQLFGEIGVDLLAGPSEILIIADESSDHEIVAADLLGQAEHGPTSPVVLVTLSEATGLAVVDAVARQLESLPSRDIAAASWSGHGEVILVADREEAVAVSDQIAPEHLEIQAQDPDWYLDRLTNYGTICAGEEATVVFSDKAIGTNHTLPTGRAARYTGGLWVGKFIKTVTYQKCSRDGATEIARHAALLSEAEKMPGHAKTCHMRIDKYSSIPA